MQALPTDSEYIAQYLTAPILDIAQRSAALTETTERRAELDRRSAAHGGLVPGDRATEAKRSALKGWGPYRAEKAADIRAGIIGVADVRSISAGRLWIDCGRAVKRWGAALSKDQQATVQSEAFCLLLRWPTHGAESFNLGGLLEQRRAERRAQREPTAARRVLSWIDSAEQITAGTLPLRRDWIDSASATRERGMTEQPSAGAWRALHAAVKQAGRTAEVRATESSEEPTDLLDIAALVEAEQRSDSEPLRLADSATPDVLARLMPCPLDAARAIVARAFPFATPTELAEQWGMTRGSVEVALSRGAGLVRKRWPDATDLLLALDDCAESYRAETESAAVLALLDYRDDPSDRQRATDAVADWRGCTAGMPDSALALLSAARCGLRRAGQPYGSARAERIAQSTARLVASEQRAAKRRDGRVRRYGRLHGSALSAQRQERPKLSAERLQAVGAARAELATLLEYGVSDADRIRALRADIAAALAE